MAYVLAYCASLVLSFVMECFSQPFSTVFYKRPKTSLIITSLLVFSLFLLALFLTMRPYFAASLSLLGIVIVVVINNTKFKTLREPLVFSDFFLYLQAIKHPRLYLPFLGVLPLVGLVLSVCLIAFLGFYFESSKHAFLSWKSSVIAALLVASIATLRKFAKKVLITKNVMTDNKKLGVLAVLCSYGAQALDQRTKLSKVIKNSAPFSNNKKSSSVMTSPIRLADIVVVQSESFFDARMLTNNIKTDVLAEYDNCLAESILHGRLQVPAWGANTMRTEFAFLTGLESKLLGLAQYYPYQQLADMQMPSMISELKLQGYRCVCVHPNDSSFFMRDVFFKNLGFDEFIDAGEFAGAKREGPYVADLEVSRKIEQVLGQTERPCFVFAITMENHGPLHLESVTDQEWQKYFDQKPQTDLSDLTVYLRHLKNADLMIKKLIACFKARERNTVFGFYGDHVPAISDVFDAYDYDDPESNYFIWSNTFLPTKEESTNKVGSLAKKLVSLAKVG